MSTFTAVFRAVADFNGAIREGARLGRSYAGVRREADLVGVSGASMGKKIARGAVAAQAGLEKTGKVMSLGVTAPIVALGVAAVRTFADFESKIVSAGSKSDATADQLARMKKEALDVGAQTKFSASQAAGALDNLAAAGFNAEDAIATLRPVTLAAQAANEDLGMTAEVTAKAMNAFNIPAAKAGHVADVFTNALNTTALTLNDLKDALGQVGEVGPRYNQSLEDVIATTGRLVDMGVPAASAGVAIRQALTSLASPNSAKAANLMQSLGLNVRTATGEMKPLPDLIREVKTKLDQGNPAVAKYKELVGLSSAELEKWAKQNGMSVTNAKQLQLAVQGGGQAFKDYATRTIFGVEGAKAFSLAMSDGKPLIIDTGKETEKLTRLTNGLAIKLGRDGANAFVKAHTQGDKFVATSADAVEAVSALNLASDGMAAKIGAAFQKTTAQKIDNLVGALQSLAIAFVQLNQGGLNDSIDGLTNFVNGVRTLIEEHPRLVRFATVFALIVAAIGPVLYITAKLIGVTKLLVGAFRAVNSAVKTGIVWMQLYGNAAATAGTKVKGGLLGPLSSVAKFIKGPWGIALAAAALILGIFVKKHLDAKKAQEEFRQASAEFADVVSQMTGDINRQSVALDQNSKQWVANRLQQQGALDMANRLGLSAQTVTDAVMGQQSAMDEVNRVLKENLSLNPGLSKANSDRRNDAEALSKILNIQSKEEQEGIRLARQRKEATGELASSQGQLGNSVLTTAQREQALADTQKRLVTVSGDLDRQIDNLSTSFSILRGKTLSNQEASDAFERAIRAMRKEMKGGTGALKDNTEKGLANREMLRGAVSALNTKIKAQFQDGLTQSNVTKKTKQASEALKVGRKRMIDSAVAAGVNRKEAKRMVDQMVLTPKELKTMIKTPGLKDALSEIKDLKKRIKALEAQSTKTFTVKWKTLANGKSISLNAPTSMYTGGRVRDTVGKGKQSYDTVPAMLAVDEHVWTQKEVAGVGGHAGVERLRKSALRGELKGYRSGGAVQIGSRQSGKLGAHGAGVSGTLKYGGNTGGTGWFTKIKNSFIKQVNKKVLNTMKKEIEQDLKQARSAGPGGTGTRARKRWHGGTFTDRFIKTLQTAQRLYRGTINVIQGGWRPRTSYSGTSHAGDAIDTSWSGSRKVRAMRGAHIAAWHRTPSQGPWGHHIHGVPLPGYGYPKGSGIWQAKDYLRGGNGLKLGAIVRGGQGGVNALIGEGKKDELVAPLPPGWKNLLDKPAKSQARPIVINVDMGDGLVKRIQGVIDDNDQFHASLERAR